ncbi:MAG: tetratricopeptide (TPR) repeat protein [Arenicella sp.]|jgi:tetratricopeptide (TPR) repeat protein
MIKLTLIKNTLRPLISASLSVAIMLPLLAVVEVTVVDAQQAQAQTSKQKTKPKTKKVQSIRQKHIKTFEKIQEAFEIEDNTEVARLLDKMSKEEDLNNIEKAYIANYRGNICFASDRLDCALREFKNVTATREGLPDSFYDQMLYVIAQVLFSQEKYREALGYAQTWFKTQENPSADAFMLVGQAHYMLKEYDKSLPNVQKGIAKYIELGAVPKEGWLNLLSSIYRQKNDYKKMLPVVKQLVLHYPKKTYLLTMAGIFNELDDQPRMTAMYQAMYDRGLLANESELVTLASLEMSQENPFHASEIMKKGFASGVVKKNLKNYRLYSQALYAAREYDAALDPLSKAAKLSKDGKLYNQLGQSFVALNRWREAEASLNSAINKGGLTNAGQTLISKGLTQFEQKKFKAAEITFVRAQKYEKVSKTASNWIKYVKAEVRRLKELDAPIQEIDTSVEPTIS